MTKYVVYKCGENIHICLKDHFNSPCSEEPIGSLTQYDIEDFLRSLSIPETKFPEIISMITLNYCYRINGAKIPDLIILKGLDKDED
ncbi:MAG: hypothetical protein JNL65_11505 [Saprospiraceae bacterium]|nr:hypothetical protein [Saprospiraceae bacterium]